MASTDFTPNLDLPYLLSNQAQKHVTLNDSLRALDAMLYLSLLGRDMNAPPSDPEEGDRYLIASLASGDWSGHGGDIAYFADGGWLFKTPEPGWIAYVEDEDTLILYDGSDWRHVQSDELQDLTRLGLNAVADANNPLTVRLNDALFTADENGNGGTGDLRLKLNKETSGNVLSLLMQTGYSSRAEIGLVGDDDLVLRVSSDGASFLESMRIDSATGRVAFLQGSTAFPERLTADRTYYVRADGDDGNDGMSAANAFASLRHAVDTSLALDMSLFAVTIDIGAGNFSIGNFFYIDGNGNSRITLAGAGPYATFLDGTVYARYGMILNLSELSLGGASLGIRAQSGSQISLVGQVRFDQGSTALIQAEGNAAIEIKNATVILASDSNSCILAQSQGLITVNQSAVFITESARTFSQFLLATTLGQVTWTTAQITVDETAGIIAGKRYHITGNGVVQTYGGGASGVPGTLSGTVTTGGQYV